MCVQVFARLMLKLPEPQNITEKLSSMQTEKKQIIQYFFSNILWFQ